MIDRTKLGDSWGYDNAWGMNQPPAKPAPVGQQKKSITRKPTEYGTQTTESSVQPVGQTATVGQTGQDTGGQMENIQYPSEWNQAGDVWSQMAGGTSPEMDWFRKMMEGGGGAFDQSGYDAANQPAMMDMFSNATKEMAEQSGMGGTRYGSGLLNSIGNYGSQLQNQYNQNKWNNAFQGYEAGMGRAMGAGQNLFGGRATGAQGLQGLGGDKNALALNLASSMGGLGQSMTNQQIDPWTQMMAQLVGQPYMTQQTYNPSKFSNVLGVLGGMPWGDIFGKKTPAAPTYSNAGF